MNLATARRRMVLAFIVGVLVALMLAWFTSCITKSSNTTGKIAADGSLPVGVDDSSFSVAGNLRVPLAPGLSAALDLRITNPADRALRIRDLVVKVSSVDAPRATDELPCTVADFTTTSAPVPITLPARSTKALSTLRVAESQWPHVSMVDSARNQDGCQDATLRLAYTGTGTLE